MVSAESMGLCPDVLRAIKRKGYRLPTPIQRRAMPLILQGLDLVGMARTGSGKTAAFVIPLVERCVCSLLRALPAGVHAVQHTGVFLRMQCSDEPRCSCSLLCVLGDSTTQKADYVTLR